MTGRRFLSLWFSLLLVTITVTALRAQEATPEAEGVSLLFVQTASSGSATANDDGTFTLTLAGVGPTVWFSDRPARLAGHMTTAAFVAAWGEGADDPPNAALEVGSEAYVLELLDVGYDDAANVLTYTVRPLDAWADAPTTLESGAFDAMTFETAALFVDNVAHNPCNMIPAEDCPTM